MRYRFPADIREATRLTVAGHLGEATALIQRVLGGAMSRGSHGSPPRSTASRSGSVIDVEPAAASSRARPAQEQSAAGQFVERSFTNSAGTRAYKLYIPTAHAGRKLPLVVMLHGCTQSPDDFAAGTRMNAAAEAAGCLVAYPAQPATANQSKCWNWFSPADQQRDRGEPSIIAGITREVIAGQPVDTQRVYVAGMSAGGAAAAVMGSTYPDLYAAIGVHSGLACGAATDLPSAMAAMRKGASGGRFRSGAPVVPAIVFHGDRDKTVHPSNADAVIAQAATGLRTITETGRVAGGHAYSRVLHVDPNGRTAVEQWVVHGGGHAWSGGSRAGSHTDPKGPDASREMLRFFLERELCVG